MSNLYLAGFDEDRGFNFLLRAQDNIRLRKKGAHIHTKGTRVMPLVGAKIQVEEHGCTRGPSALDSEKCCASAWFAAEVRSGTFKGAAFSQRGSQYVINRQLYVSGVIPIKDQRETIGWFDAEHCGTAASTGFARDKAGFDPLLLEKVQDEITDRVCTHCCEQSSFYVQSLGADRDIGGRAADIRGKTLNVHKCCTYIIGI